MPTYNNLFLKRINKKPHNNNVNLTTKNNEQRHQGVKMTQNLNYLSESQYYWGNERRPYNSKN